MTFLCAREPCNLEKRSNVKLLAEDSELQRKRLDFGSAAEEDDRNDEYFTIAEEGGALPR